MVFGSRAFIRCLKDGYALTLWISISFENNAEIDNSLIWLREYLNDSFGETKMELGIALKDGHVLRAEIAGSLRYNLTPKMLKSISKHPHILETRFAVKDVPEFEQKRWGGKPKKS